MRFVYPYAAISAFALHPLYLNLAAVADAKNQKLLAALEPERQRLNALDSLDYEAVMKVKLEFLRKIYPCCTKAATFRTKDYQQFVAENEHWLAPYAAFCFLRDKFGTADFSQWPEHRQFDAAKIAELAASGIQPGGKDVEASNAGRGRARSRRQDAALYGKPGAAAKVQRRDGVLLFRPISFAPAPQLKDAAAHTIHAAGLILKGDIAIGVFRHGVDAWQQPELYNLNLQAGAPPDAFSAKGQNWGFPTYNWPRMAADGFAWWKQRFEQMGNYFDAFRIDHILGFFRIWSSPAHAVEGILGYFAPALPLEPQEFAARGIYIDRERLLKPFINEAMLEKIFGAAADSVRQEFLVADGGGKYSLRPEFATQRQVETFFAAREQNEPNSKLKPGLFDLISDVIFAGSGREAAFPFCDGTDGIVQKPTAGPAGEAARFVRGLFFPAAGRFLDARGDAKIAGPEARDQHADLRRGPGPGARRCVPEVMRDLGFLGLEIQRMPKALGAEFSRPAAAQYLSVVTPATHDMGTIRGWWEEDRELTQKFFNRELGLAGEAPREADPEIVQAVVRQHLASPAMWSIFQWQDLAGMDGSLRRDNNVAERINIPAYPNFYWRYRLHLSLERLMQADRFTSQLKQMIVESGR